MFALFVYRPLAALCTQLVVYWPLAAAVHPTGLYASENTPFVRHAVPLKEACGFAVGWTVRIRFVQQRLDRCEDARNGESGAPVLLQHIQADVSILVDWVFKAPFPYVRQERKAATNETHIRRCKVFCAWNTDCWRLPLGWNISLKNRTTGGLAGYSSENSIINRKTPPSKGVSAGLGRTVRRRGD